MKMRPRRRPVAQSRGEHDDADFARERAFEDDEVDAGVPKDLAAEYLADGFQLLASDVVEATMV